MNEALSIGVVCYASLGGSGVIASELAVGLARRGHRVHLIASAAPSRPLPQCDRLLFHEVAVSAEPLFEHPPYALAVASTLIEVATDHGLDVVHLHYAVPHATSAFLAGQVLGSAAPRFVTTLHGTDVTRTGVDASYEALTRFSLRRQDGLTVPSEFLRAEAQRRLGLGDDQDLEVIANFVDTEHFAPSTSPDRRHLDDLLEASTRDAAPEPGPMLLHVSNFRPVKRTLDLVEVLARVRQRLPARLVLVGDGPDRTRVAARVKELGLERSVHFLGKRTDFVEVLRHADAFVLTSESESFGVAALEAQSCGVPVFAYRVGGLPEVITPDTGRLVAPSDAEALAAAIVEVLQNPGLRHRLGAAGRARAVENFGRAAALSRYEACYRRVLASPRPAQET